MSIPADRKCRPTSAILSHSSSFSSDETSGATSASSSSVAGRCEFAEDLRRLRFAGLLLLNPDQRLPSEFYDAVGVLCLPSLFCERLLYVGVRDPRVR